MSDDMRIKEGNYVILKKGKILVIVKVHRKRKVNLERKFFSLDPAIGELYGTTWEITKRTIRKVEVKAKSDEVNEPKKEEHDELEDIGDNRNIVDDNTAQKLSQHEILALKKDGMKGEELIDQIVENSATFKEKNIYSQEKYIKKKKEKHIPLFTILKPTTRLMCEMYYGKGSPKVVCLRYDSMGQMLTLGNIHANMKVMVVESCMGLLLGAVMDRMAGLGALVHMYHGESPLRTSMDWYNFPSEYFNILHSFPLNKANSLKIQSEGEKSQTQTEQTEHADSERAVKKQRTDAADDAADDVVDMTENCDSETNSKKISEEENVSDDEERKDDVAVARETGEEDDGESSNDNSVTLATDEMETTSATDERDCSAQEEKKRTRQANPERLARKEKRRQELEAARSVVQQGNFDVLVIASKCDPCPIVMKLLEFLAPSRPFMVYSQYIEPLYECFGKLRESRETVNVKITENWLREYQVLPARTHPQNTMSGSGGYLLTGIKVTS
ncbi:tRNA (adenine(58)-N(1))-methyltransferase non-catalytic subunit TRM6-like [Ptychodera flava]|uniref:tRNA (adenine(58)-N(1))-methyltransferase non-catalytic subunit TRM6-like n=1 Tax=Ptychodera flava TaxID=63121 RepID=UPI00396A666F